MNKFLLLTLLAACGDDTRAQYTNYGLSLDELQAMTTQATDVWEIKLLGDVVGPGNTQRCNADFNEFTWSTSPRRDKHNQLGFIGRERLEEWPEGHYAFFLAYEVRWAGKESLIKECP